MPDQTIVINNSISVPVISEYVTDTESDSIRVVNVSVTAGSGSVSTDGLSITYVPTTDFTGNAAVTFDVTDEQSTVSSSFTVAVENKKTACSTELVTLDGQADCAITPSGHQMTVLAFGLCRAEPTRPTATQDYDISGCELMFDGRSASGVPVALVGSGSVKFPETVGVPSYGIYTHGILLVDNEFSLEGSITIGAETCFLTNDGNGDLVVDCDLSTAPSPAPTDAITNFYDLGIFSTSFPADGVTADLIREGAQQLSRSSGESDQILVIQTFPSAIQFTEATTAIDIGVKISDALIVGDGNSEEGDAYTSPFSIQFTVR